MRPYLEPGEQVRVKTRPHGVALVRALGKALLLALLGAALLAGGSRAGWGVGATGAGVLGLAALAAGRAVARWDRTHVVLTTEKLLVVHGLARRRAVAVRLARVDAVEVEQNLAGRLLGYGTVVAGELEIPYVPHPAAVCRLLR